MNKISKIDAPKYSLELLNSNFGEGLEKEGRTYWNFGDYEISFCLGCGFVKFVIGKEYEVLKFYVDDFEEKLNFNINKIKNQYYKNGSY